MNNESAADLLRSVSLRATPGRIALVNALRNVKTPLTVEEIHAEVQNIDLVTVYRILDHLRRNGLVHEVHFKSSPVRYELHGHGHHHHIVCTYCGRIAELPECDIETIESRVLKSSSFARITEHTLEFFGSCNDCTRGIVRA